MDNKIKAQKGHLDEIRRERRSWSSRYRRAKTIERSQDLLKRIDRMVAKATGQKS
jgi:hypothetical protein